MGWIGLIEKLSCTLVLTAIIVNMSSAETLIILKDDCSGTSSKLYSDILRTTTHAGYDNKEVSLSDLPAALDRETSSGSILILPNATCFPVDAKQPLMNYLKRGNHLIAISGPAFAQMVVKCGDKWLTQSQAKDELARISGPSVIDFAKQDISKWQRHSGSPGNESHYSVVASGDSRIAGKALHAKLSKLDDWETTVSPHLAPFPHSAIAFWAKGGPNTPEMVVECREKDTSRWMAVIKLSQDWKRYVLTPEDFRFWGDGSPTDRGKQGDMFNPANAEALSLGLANGISRQKIGIEHEYWIADVQAINDPYKDVDFSSPLLESLSPGYKTYNTKTKALNLVPWNETIPVETEVVAPLPRSPGVGSADLGKHRMIPVVRALDSNGEIRGSAAHLFLNVSGDYAGSVWGYLGLDQDFLASHSDKALQVIDYMLERIHSGIFLANAGTQHIAYTEDEDTRCGAYLVNLSNQKVDYIDTMFQVFRDDKILASDYVRTELTPHSKPVYIDGTAAIEGKINGGPGVYTMKVWTAVKGKVVDEIDHKFRIIKYVPLNDENTVKAHDGDFYLNKSKWYPLGVNYWPRYSTGLEQGSNWLHWLSPDQYNPEIIEQDLSLAQKLGINLLSIQYGKPDQARPLMDFMSRAAEHGMKVHIYIPGLHPLDQNFELANRLITSAHLPQTAAFFAYDVGWEVHIGKYDRRKAYDRLWQDWVAERYGSIESAHKDWGYKPDVVDNVITGPRDEQLLNDGVWRVYVAAYRRFWDDVISKRYMAVRNDIKSIDPYHLIGARSGYGGTGFLWNVPDMAFDLKSGVKHLDFTSPEAYGLGGDRAGYLKGGLNTLYGRFVSGGKPVYWAEYGTSIWPQCNTEVIEEARAYYESILDMTYISNANGSAAWWWPGGFRLGENSDFGIINPDGTPRPAALEISKIASKFAAPRNIPEPDFFMTIDRDKYVTGYPGVFTDRFQEYVDSLLAGKTPGLRTEGTGTTSADTPLVAVGNVPCNGHNPPKYLNAEFNYVKINGKLVEDGETIKAEKGKPVVADISVGNTGDATWIPSTESKTGATALLLRVQGSSEKDHYSFLTKETPYLSDAVFKGVEIPAGASHVSIKMVSYGRAEFGEVFEIALKYD